jgi:hypothetical protein
MEVKMVDLMRHFDVRAVVVILVSLGVYFIGPLSLGLFMVSVIEWILSYIVYPLGVAILHLLMILSIASVGISSLVMTGVFTCPPETSFLPWLTNQFTAAAVSPPLRDPPQQLSWLQSKWQGVRNGFGGTPVSALAYAQLEMTFQHMGVCRIAIVRVRNDNDEHKFIGIFNTWFSAGRLF